MPVLCTTISSPTDLILLPVVTRLPGCEIVMQCALKLQSVYVRHWNSPDGENYNVPLPVGLTGGVFDVVPLHPSAGHGAQ